jgi:hypothetical protein
MLPASVLELHERPVSSWDEPRTSTSVGGVGWSFGFHEYTTRWGGCHTTIFPQSRVDPSWRTSWSRPPSRASTSRSPLVVRALDRPRSSGRPTATTSPICSVNTWNARSVEPCTVTVRLIGSIASGTAPLGQPSRHPSRRGSPDDGRPPSQDSLNRATEPGCA